VSKLEMLEAENADLRKRVEELECCTGFPVHYREAIEQARREGAEEALKELAAWAGESKTRQALHRPDVNIYNGFLVDMWDQVLRKISARRALPLDPPKAGPDVVAEPVDSVPKELKDFAARDYERINRHDPPKAQEKEESR
jgi:hypothetical protein